MSVDKLKKTDITFSNPLRYPGKKNRNNKNGSLLTKEEWIKGEVSKWVEILKDTPKYDNTPHSEKAWVLSFWLNKTFKGITIKYAKELLYDCETNIDNREELKRNENLDETSDSDDEYNVLEGNVEQGIESSQDMFESTSDEDMETDRELTRSEKEKIIEEHINKISENMLNNEEQIPEFVRNSHAFKKSKEDFVLQYVNQLFDQSSSQDIAMSYSQLPKFVQSNKYIDQKLNTKGKKQLSSWRVTKI